MKKVFLALAIVGLFASGAMAAAFPPGFIQGLDGSVSPSGLWGPGTSLTLTGVGNVGDGGTTKAVLLSGSSLGADCTVSARISTSTSSEVGLALRNTGMNGYSLTTNFTSGTFNLVKVTETVGTNLTWENESWITPTGTYDMTLSAKGSWLFGRLTDVANPLNTKTYMVNDSTYTAGGVGALLVKASGTTGQPINGTWNNLAYGPTVILPGDANMDGTTNATDLNTVLSYYNQSVPLPTDSGQHNYRWERGDFDNSGTVDATDLNTVLSYYNQTAGGLMMASVNTSTVPEPSTICLVLSGLAVLAFYGFRKR